MENKKSFIFFNDYILYFDMLNNDEAAELIKTILNYQNDRDVIFDELSIRVQCFFVVIKKDLDRNDEKYKSKCKSRSLAGKASADKRSKQTKITEEEEQDKIQLTDNQIIPFTQTFKSTIGFKVSEEEEEQQQIIKENFNVMQEETQEVIQERQQENVSDDKKTTANYYQQITFKDILKPSYTQNVINKTKVEQQDDDVNNYPKIIFDIINENNSHCIKEKRIPVSRDLFSFSSREMKELIENTKGIHSKDVISALKNYCSVSQLDETDAWYNVFSLKTFGKNIIDFFDENFSIEKYKRAKTNKEIEEEKKKIKEQRNEEMWTSSLPLRNLEGYKIYIFAENFDDWVISGRPAGDEYLKWQKSFAKEVEV